MRRFMVVGFVSLFSALGFVGGGAASSAPTSGGCTGVGWYLQPVEVAGPALAFVDHNGDGVICVFDTLGSASFGHIVRDNF